MKLRFTDNEIIVIDDLNNSIIIDIETIKRVFNLEESGVFLQGEQNTTTQKVESLQQLLNYTDWNLEDERIRRDRNLTMQIFTYAYGLSREANRALSSFLSSNVNHDTTNEAFEIGKFTNELPVEDKLFETPIEEAFSLNPIGVGILDWFAWELGGNLTDIKSVDVYVDFVKEVARELQYKRGYTPKVIIERNDKAQLLIKEVNGENETSSIPTRFSEDVKDDVKTHYNELPNMQDFIKSIYWKTFRQHYPTPEVLPLNVLGKIVKVYEKYGLHNELKYREDKGKAIGALRRSREWQTYSKSIKKSIAASE